MIKKASFALIACLVLSSPLAYAQDAKTVPATREEMQLSFAPLVKQSKDSVVNVYAERLVQRRSALFDDPFFQQFFGQRSPNRTEKQSSLGSGVIVAADGFVVTNNHVVDGADDIKIALADGREYPCKVVLKDAGVDLAVLKIQSKDTFTPMPIGNSDNAEVGDLVLAIGNPFGVGQTVTSGIVSALARNKLQSSDFSFFIQTDASINPGNSGGALMNMNGELIGINSAIFTRGGGSNGIGFAIPSNLVRVFVKAAESGAKTFERPYIGASFEPVTSDVAEALGLPVPRGALVTKVIKDGPSDKAGLKTGEVVVAVNGEEVEHPDALGYRLTTAGLGQTVDLTVIDNGKKRDMNLKLSVAPETVPRDTRTLDGNNPLAGAIVENLSPRVATELHLPADQTGVVISDFTDNAMAVRAGFKPGDIIVAMNGQKVDSTKTLAAMLADDPGFWSFDINRGGQEMRQSFR
ncbi:DegQ family serine endoprotease [Rhizobium sp. NRK18]|uniref:DegQ family serine endoprotease n=1 Tax=Rhizobium sp. NRK18 TaxID=2964667 RepID=UPI0021C355A5|nr:DegQ family serine endoprotease [Rhizobium sp. NRK18]MCQ2004424.1 DegQ family serine endoprotease [Rhizobium sp. NRK18]